MHLCTVSAAPCAIHRDNCRRWPFIILCILFAFIALACIAGLVLVVLTAKSNTPRVNVGCGRVEGSFDSHNDVFVFKVRVISGSHF